MTFVKPPATSYERPVPWLVRCALVLVMLVPAGVLALLAVRTAEGRKPVLVGVAVFTVMYVFGLFREKGIWRACTSQLAILHFAAALAALYYAKVEYTLDLYACAAGLVLIPLILLLLPAAQALGSIQRRARLFVQRLTDRTHWPEDIASCEHLPEVKVLHDLLVFDAEPALGALTCTRPQVRMVVLAALQGRQSWFPGQPERVLASAHFASEPAVRSAALRALANVRDPHLLSKIAEFATDSAPEVRRATLESLVFNPTDRWLDARRWIHAALNDRRFTEDGALPLGNTVLPLQAMDDITVWACEPGACSRRALASLILCYRLSLQRGRTPEIMQRLYSQMLDSRLHSTLRVEVGYLLHEQTAFNHEVLRKMMEYHQPSQLRLLAAAELLLKNFDELALETLREVARQPNREIALGVAQVLQSTLQIDMGLPANLELPPANSKLAAEVARRVILWTQGKWPVAEPEADPYAQTPAASSCHSSTATIERPAAAYAAMAGHAVRKGTIETPWLE